jgi:crotonobetaine/carnitine-CoA ligase
MATTRTLPWLLDQRAAQTPDATMLVWEPFDGPQQRWSYGEFVDRARRVAAGMARRGIGPGDRVLVHLDNCPEFLLSWFACGFLGATIVSTNTRAVIDELAYFSAHSGAVAAITAPRYLDTVAAAAPGLGWIAVTATDAGSPPVAAPAPADSFDALVADAPLAGPGPRSDNLLMVQYTSGTTARPKGVRWTHANALWAAQVGAMHQGLGPDDAYLVHLPLFHTNAQSYSVLSAIWAGAATVLQPRFSASRFWEVSVRNRCTWTSVVPFHLRATADGYRPDHSYRWWGAPICGTTDGTPGGIPLLGWWGMTETLTHGIVGDLHLPNRAGTMGRAATSYRIEVRRADGSPAGVDEPGELFILGVPGLSLFDGYLDDPAATAKAFDDRGWMRTGDLVSTGDDGFLSFRDRDKDMLKVGGENVAASEIERVVAGVAGVSEVAVVGAPHPMLDEVPVAFVIPADPGGDVTGLPEEVRLACVAALADFKVPREVRVVDELPRSVLNKVAKAELRTLLRTP